MKIEDLFNEGGYYVPTLTRELFVQTWNNIAEINETKTFQYLAECGAGVAVELLRHDRNNTIVRVFGVNGNIKGADAFGRWEESKKFENSTLPNLVWSWIDKTTNKYYKEY